MKKHNSTIGIPDRPERELKAADHPYECSPKCTLFYYPSSCKKSTCPNKRKNLEIKEVRL